MPEELLYWALITIIKQWS